MGERSLVVRPNFAGEVPQEDLHYLADLLREEGFDVRVGYGESLPVPEEDEQHANVEVYPAFETVCVWFAQGAITTLGGAAVLAVVQMLRDRFKKEDDEGDCIRVAELVEDRGGEGVVIQSVQLEGAEAEPKVRNLEGFESYTRNKPSDLPD